ncbi:MAG: cell division protein FtsQ/DivIB [Pseudomonadota bacterium]
MIYFPAIVLCLAAWWVARNDALKASIRSEASAMLDEAMRDPNLAVHLVRVSGGSPALRAYLTEKLQPLVGVSSMRLDVGRLRQDVEALGPVHSASVSLSPKGILKVAVIERYPAALWRDFAGSLFVVDRKGVVISPAAARADFPDLVVLLGEGALRNVPEALSVIDAAPLFTPRLRGMVRVGERRWDMVLDRDQTIMLPSEGAPEAAARVMALSMGENELADRDLSVIDMRDAARPVLRMTPRAAESWLTEQASEPEEGEDT